MKRFLILIGALFIMQTVFLIANDDIVWMKETHTTYNLEFSPVEDIFLSHGEHGGNEHRKGVLIFNLNGDTIKQIYNSEGLDFISNQGIWDAHFSADGKYLATVWEYDKDNLAHGMLEIYDTETWNPIKRIEIEGDHFSLLGASVLISPDNKTIVGITQGGFYFFDILSGQLIKHVYDFGQGSGVYPVFDKYSKDGNHIYFTSTDGRLRFLNTQTYEVDYSYNAGYGNLTISKDGSMIAFKTGLSGQAVQIMNTDTKEIIRSIPGITQGVSGLAFSNDNQYLAVTSSTISNLKLWNIKTGKDTLFSTGSFSSIDFSSDGRYFVSNLGRFLYLFQNHLTSVKDELYDGINVIYPNPTNNTINIKLNLPNSGLVRISLYDEMGKLTKSLFTGHLDKGEQNVQAEVGNLKSGVYFVKVSSMQTEITFKLIINR